MIGERAGENTSVKSLIHYHYCPWLVTHRSIAPSGRPGPAEAVRKTSETAKNRVSFTSRDHDRQRRLGSDIKRRVVGDRQLVGLI